MIYDIDLKTVDRLSGTPECFLCRLREVMPTPSGAMIETDRFRDRPSFTMRLFLPVDVPDDEPIHTVGMGGPSLRMPWRNVDVQPRPWA